VSVFKPDGPGVDTRGAANTECLVLVHTHDRGPKNPSTAIDLSPYITSVSTTQHLIGGGVAQISMPAVDHMEDVLGAGDIVNIYFNTNRSNENLYNTGRVRTFFGYINSISKSISVGGSGTKLTSYTISCKDFSKAIRNTEIYNNEHLSSQSRGGKGDVTRADLSSNIGGIALLNRGIALEGTPRKIILQNLMRFLGFGGQWALPPSYKEGLGGATWNFKVIEDKDTLKTSLQAVYEAALKEKDDTTLAMFAEALAAMSQEVGQVLTGGHAASVSAFWDAVPVGVVLGESTGWAHAVSELKAKYHRLSYKLEPSVDSRGHIGNTFFTVQGIIHGKKRTPLSTVTPTVTVDKKEQRLESTLERVIEAVLAEIEGTNPSAIKESFNSFPLANQLAQKYEHTENNDPVYTIFNILCLDYMEDVGGFWAKLRMMNHQGSLMSALQPGSNPTMNEFFLDLRPSPLFTPADKDGLGIDVRGAIPMVPAVVLRRKPFTNYRKPSAQTLEAQIDGNMVVGGMTGATDQLLINSGGAMGASGASPVKVPSSGAGRATARSVVGALEELGKDGRLYEIGDFNIVEKTITPPTKGKSAKGIVKKKHKKKIKAWQDKMVALAAAAAVTGVNKNKALVDIYNASDDEGVADAVVQTQVLMGGVTSNIAVATKALSTIITLPRPIFRSPDNCRITRELDLSRTQYVLGFLETIPAKKGVPARTKFYAFEAKPDAGIVGSTHAFTFESKLAKTKTLNADKSGNPHKATRVILTNDSRSKVIKAELEKAAGEVSKLEGKHNPEDTDWHVLDYMTIRPEDVSQESYTRGDFDVVNVLEYFGSTTGGFEAERLFLGTVMPIMTPISIYRFGVRAMKGRTEHVQAMLTGGSEHLHEKNILLRWAILQDMWNQHNHELLAGSMSLRGMPGLRPGYRVDRPDVNLSFYVEQVAHSWTYPGALSTNISVSRGQPMDGENALDYERPTSQIAAHKSERQNLGRIFKTSEYKRGGKDATIPPAGSFTGKTGVGGQIKDTIKAREDDPGKAANERGELPKKPKIPKKKPQ